MKAISLKLEIARGFFHTKQQYYNYTIIGRSLNIHLETMLSGG